MTTNGKKEILVTGFGGQGIVLLGKILGAAAAIGDHKESTLIQAYGPESRGGACSAQVMIADTVIHYDPWWNPAVEAQATGRAHRIGQNNSVWVVKLVAQGTIEERILALQDRKAALAESMYSGAVGRKQPLFSESDLAELLKPLST